MSTMEKLLVQLFQRKNGIIDQVQAQIDLFDQHHASKLLIDGIDPPSWLRNPTFAHSRPFDPSEFQGLQNTEEDTPQLEKSNVHHSVEDKMKERSEYSPNLQVEEADDSLKARNSNSYRPKRKLGNQKRSQIRYNNKESQTPTVGANGVEWAAESSYNRFKRPKLAGKTSLREGGSSLSKTEQPKHKNIVSRITSFIPLVQQKQAAAALPVKREIKVKALEAAEAAKRLAEKKENERKTKKEALKIERARREKENLRQLELQKKKKEEELKKKGADMAAKKRQREEEEKKEKERKRMRLEEARKQHKEHEQKLHAQKQGKDKKFRNSVNNLEKTIENKSFSANTIREQPYDISPYNESEEDKEEDDKPNNKPVPLWASKINVALAREYQSQLDPEKIFPPQVFCSIAEVLLPRKYQL